MQIIEKTKLKNELILELINKSRRLAGDRWLVSLEARIEIPVNGNYLDKVENKNHIISALKKFYGDNVEYSYVQEKHFVDEKEKDKILDQFLKNVKNLMSYLSHPDFAKKTLLARYRDLKRKAPWILSQ